MTCPWRFWGGNCCFKC